MYLPGDTPLELREILVRPVGAAEERRYQELLQQHHYLGTLPKISETLWYVATWREEWVALLSFSASALKCGARDRWIGWNFRQRYRRLKLVANNSRFLILPEWHAPNLGSRVLALCQKRVGRDWEESFGHRVVLLETFVDPVRFRGTIYRAANWIYVGNTRGFRRTRLGYSARAQSPKMVFVQPLRAEARERSIHLIEWERRKLCSAPRRWNRCPGFLPEFPIPAVPKASVIACPRYWASRPGPCCVACAATRPSPIGRRVWVPRPGGDSAAVGARVAMRCPANTLSAMC
jgi:Druantia protein DruA